ncbi:MAG: 3'(2'),5'-bisphosphate nucleotidase CysQ [Rhodospirillales bacterium]|nr:3'(2'),5'-bisphosphate nucleotidase CysQ [Rhodospirillales bacterium]
MARRITDAEIGTLLDTAREAGRAILGIYETEFEVRAKDDASPVTEADVLSESIILPVLREITPEIPIIAEEAYAAGDRPDVSGGEFWLVDALDGTKEFVKRTGEFTVNIGLIRDNLPVFGIVHAPAMVTTYWGGENGVFRQSGDGAAEPIAVRAPGEEGLVVMTSRSHRANEEEFLEDYTVRDEMHAGSSIKFCLVAAGEADFYPRLGPTCEWDTAAGHAILRAAGGSVRTLDGGDLKYGKPDFLNPFFLARGDWS